MTGPRHQIALTDLSHILPPNPSAERQWSQHQAELDDALAEEDSADPYEEGETDEAWLYRVRGRPEDEHLP